jgi:integrase
MIDCAVMVGQQLLEGEMAKVKYLKTYETASGATRYAFSPSATLQKALGYSFEVCADFSTALAKCQAADEAFQAFKKTGFSPFPVQSAVTSYADILDAYFASSRWASLKPGSRRTYRSVINTVSSMTLDGLQPMRTISSATEINVAYGEKLYAALVTTNSINYANAAVNILSAVWDCAIYMELLAKNPFSGIRLLKAPSRSVRWTPNDVRTFIDTADACGIPSIGTIALMAYELCQRPIDCRSLRWSAFNDGAFFIQQAKTGAAVNIPATPALSQRMTMIAGRSNQQPDDVIAPYEVTGQQYSERLYRKKAAFIRSKAGLPEELKLSDLRRSGATVLGESGCSEDEIRSITGHKSRQIVSTYVVPTSAMAAAAQQKRINNTGEIHGNTSTTQVA